MDLIEVLKFENNGKQYICKANGIKIRNNNGALEYLKGIVKGKEVWCLPYFDNLWLESEYKEA